ncbi:hypothetical protein BVRB_025090 [Beta vulgaris subsp. vulgaris]|uniref:Zinc-finger domain-containing protein n=1 Tax=Beta vulgaris subsp. vulgaris TaxID=3555 RepID=A0A0J8AZD3_BETVV|nr:hypothetical protein BVRB_025090 [Beta vulgaris subsp. vulgaris]
MTPKTKVPVGAGGSSCHQCKNRREANQLNFCRNRIRSETNPKRKICRKKFCDHCLVKFRYNQVVPRGNKDMADWECPSCLGICVCAACKRKADPSLQFRPEMNKDPQEYTVTMSFAHKLLTDPTLISHAQSSNTL